MGYYNGKSISASEFRQMASNQCKLAGGDLTVTYLVYFLIMGGISAVLSFAANTEVQVINGQEIQVTTNYLETIVSLLISGPFMYSLIYVAENVYYRSKVSVGDIFVGFKKLGGTLVIYLLTSLFTFLWSLLFIIPGIIKSYSYSMAMYVYKDHPELSAKECINLSKQMMDGHKWDLFCLHISYFGWILLSILTCGILFLWVRPKMQQAEYLFYKEVCGNNHS